MRRYLLTTSIVLGLCFIALIGCAEPGPTVAQARVPPGKPGTARIWFLRGSISPNPAVQAFAPMIYVNGAPIATIPQSAGFYRDFAPGSYTFTVQPFGLPTAQATTIQLLAGSANYLNVDWVASWTQGYPPASWNFVPNTFAIVPMTPRVAEAYLSNLAYLGER